MGKEEVAKRYFQRRKSLRWFNELLGLREFESDGACAPWRARPGVSKSTVQRIWSQNEIKPHRLETFTISNDPNFEEKFWDVIGLYLDPPERAWCSVATRSQCQALAHNALSSTGEWLRTHPEP
jgi:hypothetical protein